MAPPEYILGRIRAKLACDGPATGQPYRPPSMSELVQRIERAIGTRG